MFIHSMYIVMHATNMGTKAVECKSNIAINSNTLLGFVEERVSRLLDWERKLMSMKKRRK